MSYYPTKRWKETSPEAQEIDNRVFEDMLRAIGEEFPHINSVLAIKNGCIVFEKYFNGHQKSSKQKVGCIYKSFISAVTGIALKEHVLDSLDTRITDIFSDYTRKRKDSKFNQITIKHGLTKTTGLKWKGPDFYRENKEYFTDDIEKFYELDLKDNPGEVFEYKPDPQIVVSAIEKLAGEEFATYCSKKLFGPLNITNYYWSTDMNSIENMEMTTRDIAKLGYLYLKDGVWEDNILMSKKYCQTSTTGKIHGDFPENAEYGYLWWEQEINGVRTFYASGFGGQYLCVIPKYELIVVITSTMDRPHPENKSVIRNLLYDIALEK